MEDQREGDPLLTTAQVAEQVGMSPASWRSLVHECIAPKADDPDDGSGQPANRRRPRWRQSTVDAWVATRRPRGRPRKPQEQEGGGGEEEAGG